MLLYLQVQGRRCFNIFINKNTIGLPTNWHLHIEIKDAIRSVIWINRQCNNKGFTKKTLKQLTSLDLFLGQKIMINGLASLATLTVWTYLLIPYLYVNMISLYLITLFGAGAG